MLNEDAYKLEIRLETRLFVGHPKGIEGGYSPQNQNIVISTNVRLLGNDYLNNHKPNRHHSSTE